MGFDVSFHPISPRRNGHVVFYAAGMGAAGAEGQSTGSGGAVWHGSSFMQQKYLSVLQAGGRCGGTGAV